MQHGIKLDEEHCTCEQRDAGLRADVARHFDVLAAEHHGPTGVSAAALFGYAALRTQYRHLPCGR